MPRDFDSDNLRGQLTFTENVTCSGCGEVFEGTFIDYSESQSVEDMVDPPAGVHVCPECGYGWKSEMTGWMFYSEAG